MILCRDILRSGGRGGPCPFAAHGVVNNTGCFAGKSTFLAMLLRMLQAWLCQKDDDLLQFIRCAMYTKSELRPEEQTVVCGFLAALKGLAGKDSKWNMTFLVRCALVLS